MYKKFLFDIFVSFISVFLGSFVLDVMMLKTSGGAVMFCFIISLLAIAYTAFMLILVYETKLQKIKFIWKYKSILVPMLSPIALIISLLGDVLVEPGYILLIYVFSAPVVLIWVCGWNGTILLLKLRQRYILNKSRAAQSSAAR